MNKIQLSVSVDTYQTKPTSEEYKKMNFKGIYLNVLELMDLIIKGHSFCHNFNRNEFPTSFTANKNFTNAYFIVLDFDHSPLSFDFVMSNIKIKPSIAFQTFSNCDTDYRFKLIYLFDNPITSIQDYRLKSEMVYNRLFNEEDNRIIFPSLDTSCYSAVQLFLGTSSNQKIQVSDTIIASTDFTNSIVCPKKEHQFQLSYPSNDLNLNYTFGTTANNSIYCKNPYNNFHSAVITDPTKSYFYVGNQDIYSLSTYMKSNKVENGKRHKTMKYHLIVIKNMYPSIGLNEMFNRMRWLVDTYYSNPNEIDDNQIYRMCKSIISIEKRTDTGKRKYILNPAFNHLSKIDKIKEFQKCKSEHTKEEILASADMNKSYIELSDELGFCPSTIRKYLKSEGIDLVKTKSEYKFKKFEELYYAPENIGKPIRQLSKLAGISKSQVSRYINRIKNE